MELIDTHCHLDLPEFDQDRQTVLVRARAAGLVGIVIPGVHRNGWPGLLGLCNQAQDLYPALGLHPVYLANHQDTDISALETAIAAHTPVAIGEIGLDYVVRDLDRDHQQRLLEAQLEIARSADLPVLLHVRKAHAQMLSTLKRIRVRGGIVHAFSGGVEEARGYESMGFKLGFGGMLTFERSNKLRRLAANLSLDSIVLETDAPDLTVAAHRGERNSPHYLPDVLTALAQVRDTEPARIAAATTFNARAVLGLPTLPAPNETQS